MTDERLENQRTVGLRGAWRKSATLLLVCTVGATARAAAIEGNDVDVWSGEGPHRVLRSSELPTVTVERTDVQYGRSMKYQGSRLEALLAAAKPPSTADVALLRFANGMIVPVPFRDAEAMRRLDVVIARRFWAKEGTGEMDWNAELPSIEKKDTGQTDIRPIVFRGNKVAVAERWHPAVPTKASAVFSPWLYVDSLVGVELVNGKTYQSTFGVGVSKDERRGFELFTQSCQFCHGVKGKGATFGWDFVEPVALFTYRKPDSLHMHVKHRAGVAAKRGLMMPELSYLTPEDSKALWEWMRAVAASPK